jgi:adenine-specific DNA-methyltransferase
MTDLNDLLVTSPDLNKERLETLKRLFPDLFTNEEKLNPAELKRLFEDEATTDREQYIFTWRGKGKAKKHAFTPSRAALTYDPERSVNPDKADGNMIIEGENLEVLKLLTSAYREQVKYIYIDPPYNTGGDFIYPDNYTKSRKEYWEENGTYKNGVKLDTNPESSGRYHSDWLSMMYSRLLVARQLLKGEGLIFVSIDDKEVHNLRKVMDDIFGKENFLALCTWRGMHTVRNSSKDFNQNTEFVIVFAKDKATLQGTDRRTWLRIPKDKEGSYSYDDNDEKGSYKLDPLHARNFYTPFKHTFSNGVVWEAPRGRYPAYAPDTLKDKEEKKEIAFPGENLRKKSGEVVVFSGNEPMMKRYLKDVLEGIPPDTLLPNEEVGFSKDGTAELEKVFGVKVFDQPKPTSLLKYLLKIKRVCDDVSDKELVLDFFAGSGATADAVMALNREDEGNRRYILIQLPEAIDEGHEAYKAGYRTISQITIERNKRVIQGYGDDSQPLDTGFKVYSLTKSHFPRAEFQPDPDKSNEENIELLKKYITEKEASFHMAFEQDKVFDEVLLKHGFKLDYKLTKQEEFEKNTVYMVEEGDRKAYICLDTIIADETIDFFKTHKDKMFICLERALDTTKKWNLNHTLGERLKAL